MKVGSLSHTHSEVDTAISKAVQAMNYGPSEWTIDGIADGSEPSGEITVTTTAVIGSTFGNSPNITSMIIDTGTKGVGPDTAYSNMKNLKSVYVKSAPNFPRRTFLCCTSLKSFIIARDCAANPGSWHFEACPLEFFDGGNMSAFGAGCMYGPVKTIILRRTDKIVTCGFSSFPTFSSTSTIGEGKSGCDIYVPEALIDIYRADTNWAAWDATGTLTWHAIEGSEYE